MGWIDDIMCIVVSGNAWIRWGGGRITLQGLKDVGAYTHRSGRTTLPTTTIRAIVTSAKSTMLFCKVQLFSKVVTSKLTMPAKGK